MSGKIDYVANYVANYVGLLLATQRSDRLDVFQALRAASQDRHLPAFQRGAGRG